MCSDKLYIVFIKTTKPLQALAIFAYVPSLVLDLVTHHDPAHEKWSMAVACMHAVLSCLFTCLATQRGDSVGIGLLWLK